ncbi:MAG: type II toxin-antitoxin system HicA family toxin [Candidatus Latescibacteria bacterium]|jgi:predicted RNA binding protein YcfA (HicA-like mRNA interferase family)|nr:type II toxin-antitoxin system HicA family toxin [Candidatus Latescibacterota bacterium]
MNRRSFVRGLVNDGCVLLRQGARHDIYVNPSTGQKQPVPRHSEIDDRLARHIRRYLGLVESER